MNPLLLCIKERPINTTKTHENHDCSHLDSDIVVLQVCSLVKINREFSLKYRIRKMFNNNNTFGALYCKSLIRLS